jgi:hypothetical protein
MSYSLAGVSTDVGRKLSKTVPDASETQLEEDTKLLASVLALWSNAQACLDVMQPRSSVGVQLYHFRISIVAILAEGE